MKNLYIAVIGIFVFIFLSILLDSDTKEKKIDYKVASSNISNSIDEFNITILDTNTTPTVEENIVSAEKNETKENNDTNSTNVRYCSKKVHIYRYDDNFTSEYEFDDENRVVLIRKDYGEYFKGEIKFSYDENSRKVEVFNSKIDTYKLYQDDKDEYNRNIYHRIVYRDSEDDIMEYSVSIEYDENLQEPNDEDIEDINNLTQYQYFGPKETKIKYHEKYNEDGKKVLAYTTLNGNIFDRIVYKYNDDGSLATKTFFYSNRTSKTIFYSNNGKIERIFEESSKDINITDGNYSDDYIFQDNLYIENIYNDEHQLIQSRHIYDDGNFIIKDEYKYDKDGNLASDIEYDQNGSITSKTLYKNGELIKVIEDGKVVVDVEFIPCE